MMALRERLPIHIANLIWQQGGNLLSKVFLKVISFPLILYDASPNHHLLWENVQQLIKY
jgi:hypothetical protein